jgi:sialidase-1
MRLPGEPAARYGGAVRRATALCGQATLGVGTKAGVAESTHDGRSWRWLSDIPLRAGDRAADDHELHAVEAADGRIVVHIRNHSAANAQETLQCESRDGGKTWSVPHLIGVWDCRRIYCGCATGGC